MKKIKILILFVILFISAALCQTDLPKPHTEEWKKLPIKLRREACKLPDDSLSKYTTKELIEKCLRYDYMFDVLATEYCVYGLKSVTETYNGLQELFRREDAGKEILSYYSKIEPEVINLIGSLSNQGAFIHQTIYLELYLMHPKVLDQFKNNEKEVIKIIMNNYDRCLKINEQNKEKTYSGHALRYKCILMFALLDRMNSPDVNNNIILQNNYKELKERPNIAGINNKLFMEIIKCAKSIL